MENFESKMHANKKAMGDGLEDRLNIPFLKYFWMASQLSGTRVDNIPKFLRGIDVLRAFTENELRVLSRFLHLRFFEDGEVIFEQGNIGIGFYFILTGNTELWIRTNDEFKSVKTAVEATTKGQSLLMTLERGEYFGELALLQETSYRSATAMSQGPTQLLGFFRPDLEELIDIYPVVAAKFLQSIANILANRLQLITTDYKTLKNRLQKLEGQEVGKESLT